MGKMKPMKPPASAVERVEAEPKTSPEKLDLNELVALKQALDSVACKVAHDAGYSEWFVPFNVKNVMLVLACAFTCSAHFLPGDKPIDKWWPMFACVMMYLGLNAAASIVSYVTEGEAFYVSKPHEETNQRIFLSSELKGELQYTIKLQDAIPGSKEVSNIIEKSFSANKFFHEDGYCAEDLWAGEVQKLMAAFEELPVATEAKKTR